MSALTAHPVAYLDARSLRAVQPDRLLGVLTHGNGEGFGIPSEVPQARSGLTARAGDACFETWLSPTPIVTETHSAIRCARNDVVLFGVVEFEVGRNSDFQQETLGHYLRLFALLDGCDYPHLLRVWHYLPEIHLDEGGLERYKRFCLARHEAFVRSGRNIARDAPAASAVGRGPGCAVIAFLAGKQRALAIENPRQMSAYRYPEQYGPRGPTFARAAYAAWGGFNQLYVSGTASIVGHQSRHAGNAAGQAEETIRNLRTLFAEARQRTRIIDWERVLFKIYLRPGVAQEDVLRHLGSAFEKDAIVLVLEAEICRPELLLEIEAIAWQRDAV